MKEEINIETLAVIAALFYLDLDTGANYSARDAARDAWEFFIVARDELRSLAIEHNRKRKGN